MEQISKHEGRCEMRTDIREELASQLQDILTQNPDGLVRDEIISILGLEDVHGFHVVKGALQDRLANDSMTVVGDSRTALHGGWTWSLQANPAHPSSIRYNRAKARGLFGRQSRALDVAVSLARGTPGNTNVGKAARRAEMSLRHSLEITADLLEEMGIKALPLPPPLNRR
jgi:hypothetical protein